MSECKLDHTHDDVRKKYESQLEFLPKEMHPLFEHFFASQHSQQVLNGLFHLLKKYDLVSDEEKEERNKKIIRLFT
ncbi:group-specific protein [Bacillus benzoevorans]|uniref:Citrate synthase n=1 Tax=Bacillus benzoevorans TaxID=1456 RepID=A0A7X0HTM6_9BACI|nr:group-specific protein [Bacillus benzoevorans]MBB6445371.1 citrate synthase [Bacillus benzoevorans]